MNRWVAAWETWLENDRELAPSTCRLYKRYVESLERDMGRSGPLEKLSASDLRSWLHSTAGAAASYGNRVAALRSFYGYLTDVRSHLKENPAASLEIPKRAPGEREPVRDLKAKLLALDALDERVERRVGESSDIAIFLAQTGMRVSDACALSLKPPVPRTIAIPRRRGPDTIIELTDEARLALDRLGGRIGIGTRALQRRFEKAGFHPDQLRHWYRVNLADRDLRDSQVEPTLGRAASFSEASTPRGNEGILITNDPQEQSPAASDALTAVGRFLRLTEDVASVLVREARRQGKTWEEIANALCIPEAVARDRFAA